MTFCASCFADGTPGPVAISASLETVSASIRKEIDDKYKGQIYVLNNTESTTHFMTSETILEMYENLYRHAYRLKRAQLNMEDRRGFLMCDGFTGAHRATGGHIERRDRFAESCNLHLPPEFPGGWSAKGQPCDQIFNHYKLRCRLASDVHLGFGSSYFASTKYEALPIGATGQTSYI